MSLCLGRIVIQYRLFSHLHHSGNLLLSLPIRFSVVHLGNQLNIFIIFYSTTTKNYQIQYIASGGGGGGGYFIFFSNLE